MKHKRICIHAKDIALILGISSRHANRYLQVIRKAYGKEKHQFISIKEFADYCGLDEQEVQRCCL